MMEQLIEYFEEQLKLRLSDLYMDESDRMILVGKILLLEEIKDINEKGYPKDEEVVLDD